MTQSTEHLIRLQSGIGTLAKEVRPRAARWACGLRRHEAAELTIDHIQQREEHWAIVDLVGKGGHVRTIPVPD